LDHPQRHYTNRDLKRVELRYGCPLPGCVAPDTPSILTAHEDAASVDNLAKLILEKDPEVILTHPPADYTDEHTCTNMLVKKAFLNARKDGFDGSLVFYAVPPYLGYGAFYERWDSFIDTTGFHEKKLDAIACHACQMPDKNKVKLFDYERGERCGCKTAEAFTICELSESRKGELSKELAENHKFCLENWQKMIFSHKI
jgi:LmbE family N-acetylglucosaminyl deacetylase